MHVLIMGCDDLGAHLASVLAGEGHRVTVMDARPDRLDTLPEGPHMEAVLTSDSLMADMRSVGMTHVGAFLALSEDDNRNAMAAQVARHIFHVHEVVCRVSDPRRGQFYKELGMDVVCPTLVLADTVSKALKDAS